MEINIVIMMKGPNRSEEWIAFLYGRQAFFTRRTTTGVSSADCMDGISTLRGRLLDATFPSNLCTYRRPQNFLSVHFIHTERENGCMHFTSVSATLSLS